MRPCLFKAGRLVPLLAVASLLTACTAQTDIRKVDWSDLTVDSGYLTDGYQPAAEADGLRLLVDEVTGAIAVENGETIWYSNPPEPENDPFASGTVQDRMRSQFMLYYYDENSELKTMNSYTDSAGKEQHSVEYLDNGVEFTFTLGSFEQGTESIPQQLTDARFRELFLENEALSEKDRRFVEKRYREENGVWVLRATDSNLIISQLLDILQTIDYDEEQLQADNAAAGIETVTVVRTAFRIAVRYTLEDGGLRVTVPMEKFRYTDNVEPVRLELLEFFGAAENTADGYVFVPDGSGALIHLETGTASDTYEAPVYGTQSGDDGTQTVRLPVYGLKNGNAAFVAMIEKGDALASIHAYKSGISCARSGVYSSFTLKESGYVTLGDQEEETEILSFQRELYEGDLSVLFRFLQNDDADYVGMATAYRQRLLEQGVLADRVTGDDYSLTVQTVGAVVRAQSFLMIRYEGWEALTTFEQIGEMADWLGENGVTDVRFQMTSWLTGGMQQSRADTASPMSVLGGKGDLKRLLKKAGETDGVQIEGLVNFGSFKSKNFFTRYSNTARKVDQSMAQVPLLDLVTQKSEPEDALNILTPTKLVKVAEKFSKKNFGDGFTVMVGDLADVLYGDYNRNGTVHRQKAASLTTEALAALAGEQTVSVSGGNAYALLFADYVGDISLTSSGFSVLDVDIPFYSLVLHGYVELCTEPLNYQADSQSALLEAIAAGTQLSCLWMAADSSVLKDTDYSQYYSACYKDTREDVVSAYEQAAALIGDLQSQAITDHGILQEGVTVTVYENGAHIYVNRTDTAVTVYGMTLSPASAVRTDGKEVALYEETEIVRDPEV